MKKIILLLFISTAVAYSQNPKSLESIPKNYHLIEMNSVDFEHDNFIQKTVFKYNENGTIKNFEMSSKMFHIKNLFSYKDGFISEILFDNSNSDLSALTVFNYESGKLSTIISKGTTTAENTNPVFRK